MNVHTLNISITKAACSEWPTTFCIIYSCSFGDCFIYKGMLELEAENSGAGEGQFKPPKYISLRGTLNTFGRGYKANIRMPFSWLSRNHATVSVFNIAGVLLNK